MEKMTLFVKYFCRPGVREQFVRELEDSGVADKVRAEDGCLCYRYYYPAAEENTVLLLEQWVSPRHQQEHMTRPHMEQLREIKHRYVADTVLGEDALLGEKC